MTSARPLFVLSWLLFCLGAFLPLSPVNACQCLPAISVEEAIASSVVIVRGRVVEVVHDFEDEYLRTVRVEVHAYWKDDSAKYLPVIEVRDHALACSSGIGEDFTIDTEWVVLADRFQGELDTSECLYTMRWHNAETYGIGSMLGDPLVVAAAGVTFSKLKGRYDRKLRRPTP
jgi:hypothetical protein